MDPKNKGLVIRRKADKDAGETQPLGALAVAEIAAAPEPAKPLAAPAPGLVQAAPEALAPVVQPAPAAVTPAVTPAPQDKPIKATADDGRGKVWRAEASEPAPTEKEAEPTATYERPTEMPTTDDFAAMLGDSPMASADPHVGERVKATIVAIGADNIFVALGSKSEGVLSSGDFVDGDGNLTVAIGDEIEAVVVSVGGDGVRLATALGGAHGGSEMLEEAQQAGIPVEGRVTGTNKGGFDVEVMGARGFCPFSQMDLDSNSEPETYVGQTLLFLVQRVEEGGRNVVVSRAALLRQERAAKAAEILDTIKEGAIFNGIVSRVQDFGAFVDIGGVDGLVHVSEISYSRLDHPSEMLKEGDAVRVVVMRVQDIHDDRNRRIGLSMKSLDEDPWGAAMRELQAGTTIQGTVSRLEAFGAFVELRPGVDGLVHVSEIAQGKRINHPKDVLTVGDDIEVQVMRVDPQKRQIALS
ncbi:MAG: small subunit ribosomal protein S1, partial [Flavobacteriales bacterium]